jgi:hypothetical protein
MVADGLGHGPAAAEASQAALEAFEAQPLAEPRELLQRADALVRGTRGAAVSVLRLDAQNAAIDACGAGNVVARVVSGIADKSVLMQHGTVGVQMRRPEQVAVPWPEHALVVVHSDGIETRWLPQRLFPVLQRDPVLAAGILVRDHCRGRDDATVVVLRRRD